MKKLSPILMSGLTAGWFVAATLASPQFATASPVPQEPAAQEAQPVMTIQSTTTQAADQTNAAQAVEQTNTMSQAAAVAAAAAADAAGNTNDSSVSVAENGVKLNFRGVPLDTVLTYLSKLAGITIIRKADTRTVSSVDLVSETPVPKANIGILLNKVLANYQLGAMQDNTTTPPVLTIDTVADIALLAGTPIDKFGGEYTNIPADSEVVTEVITLHSLNPVELVRDLTPLKPADAILQANAGGNAVIMTARRADVRRFAELITDLDSSTIGDVGVYMLKYADSKSVAQELKDLFTTDAGGAGGNPFAALFGGRGGRGGGGGGAGGAAGGGAGDDRRSPVKVNAVSDDENNAVLVSAPVDYLPMISNLIGQLDIPQEDVVEIHVFQLKHSDPTDIANYLSYLFPDPNSSAYNQNGQQNNRGRGAAQFQGRGGRGGGGGGAAAGGNLSSRLMKQATVMAVPDERTASVIVYASHDTMVTIKDMIEELDSNDARQLQVFVYNPDNFDAMDVQQNLQDLFGSQSRSTSSSTQANPLAQRAQSSAQNTSMTTSTGLGSSGGGGGAGGGGAARSP